MRKTRAAAAVLSALVMVPLSAGTAQAQFPGEAGRIAFIRGGDVYTAAANGTGVKRLTATPAVESTPKWSPDGKVLAFVRNRAIYTMPAAGGRAVKRYNGTSPSWSPDGRFLAFIGKASTGWQEGDDWTTCEWEDVMVGPAAGGTARGLDGYNAGHGCSWQEQVQTYGPTTSWSPDGMRVLAAGLITNDYDESVQTTEIHESSVPYYGTETRATWAKGSLPAYRTPEVDYSPTNLQNFVFATNAGDPNRTGRLWVYNRSGTYKKQASTDKDVRSPVYSPTGTEVLYAQHTRGQQPKLRLVTLRSTTPRTVLTNASQPDWQRVR